jgi:hypothetical protein
MTRAFKASSSYCSSYSNPWKFRDYKCSHTNFEQFSEKIAKGYTWLTEEVASFRINADDVVE